MSQHSHSSSHGDLEHRLGHILPLKYYFITLGALLVLTILTVAAAYQDFGAMNLVVAMVIASIKALLVALFFMHLKYENPITWIYAFFPLLLLSFLIGGLFLDNPFRIDGKTMERVKYDVEK